MKVIAFGICFFDAMTFGVLPDIALFASNAVSTVIDIHAVYATDRTVKHPFIFLLLELFKLFLPLFQLCLEMTFRVASIRVFTVRLHLLEASKLFFMKYALDFAFLQSLLAGHHTRLSILRQLVARSLEQLQT